MANHQLRSVEAEFNTCSILMAGTRILRICTGLFQQNSELHTSALKLSKGTHEDAGDGLSKPHVPGSGQPPFAARKNPTPPEP